MLLILAVFFAIGARGQLYVADRGVVFLDSGTMMYVQGGMDGRADILGSGVVVMGGSALQRLNMHGFGLPGLRLANPAGVVLDGDLRIYKDVVLEAGRVWLGPADLRLSGGIDGYGPERWIVTDGTGMLVRDGLNGKGTVFPVGRDDGYRPVSLEQLGTAESIGVRVLPGERTSAAVNQRWELREFSAGSNDLRIAVGWQADDELPGFDRSLARLVRKEEGNEWVTTGTRFGLVATGVTKAGVFSVVSGAGFPSGLRVFPNPARDGFFVNGAGRGVLELFGLDGKLVSRREVDGDGEIYFALGREIAAGEYLLRIAREGGSVESKKIAVIK